MKRKISTERCIYCLDLTGKMGEDDNSIYIIPLKNDKFKNFKKGIKAGPFCEDCYNFLVEFKYVDPEEGHYPGQRPIY